MNDDVGISAVGGNGVCHGGSVDDGKYLACEVHVDIAGTRRGDGVGNRDRRAWPDYVDNADAGGGGGISNVDCHASGPAVSVVSAPEVLYVTMLAIPAPNMKMVSLARSMSTALAPKAVTVLKTTSASWETGSWAVAPEPVRITASMSYAAAPKMNTVSLARCLRPCWHHRRWRYLKRFLRCARPVHGRWRRHQQS